MSAGEAPPSWRGRRLHFIAICGAGMSALALVAKRLGAEVTGSDRAESSYCARLREAGIRPAIGHDPANVPAGAEVVRATAVPDYNPELVAARDAGASVLHRGELLAEVSRLRPCIAVAGTHGKTTTASMATHALRGCGEDPPYLIGGELRSTGTNAEWGEGPWMVIETDESDRSFLRVKPEVTVITNVELDHHVTYPSTLELNDAFRMFTASAGQVIAWADLDQGATGPLGELDRGRLTTFGIEAGDVQAEGLALDARGSRFEVDGARVELRVPGRHNVLNALGALAACRAAGVEPAAAAAALADFSGAGRRFEWRGETASGAVVYDDYAHHPTEVEATLEAARTLGARRLIACFQPHLYSRTERLQREFGRALALADLVCVVDVYPARERAEEHPGVSGLLVAASAADAAGGRPVYWLPAMEDAERLLGEELGEGDVLLTLGAGDIGSLAGRLVAPKATAAAGR